MQQTTVMSNLDLLLNLIDISHDSLLVHYPDMAWTCQDLRLRLIKLASSTHIDLDKVDIRAGKWLLRHGAMYEDKTYYICSDRYLRILSTTPVSCRKFVDRPHCHSETPTISAWFACKHLKLVCKPPTRPVSESFLSEYFASNTSIEFMYTPYIWKDITGENCLDPYLRSWPPESLLCLFRHIVSRDDARRIIDLLETKVSKTQIIDAALEKGGGLLHLTYLRYQHPISCIQIYRVVHTKLDWLVNTGNTSFLAALLTGGYASSVFMDRVFWNAKCFYAVLAKPGTTLPLATVQKALMENLPASVFATLREMFGDETLLELRAEAYQRSRYSNTTYIKAEDSSASAVFLSEHKPDTVKRPRLRQADAYICFTSTSRKPYDPC